MNVIFDINLQLFADGEKTEKPTPKKRKDAREKGQVVKSKELTSVLLLLITFVTIKLISGYMINVLKSYSELTFTELIVTQNIFTKKDLNIFFMNMVLTLFKVIGPILAVSFIIALVVNYMQVGFLFSGKAIQFKLSRINPIEGFKKIFSMRSLVELIKSLVKIFIIGYVAYDYSKDEIYNIYKLYDMDINNISKYIGSLIMGLVYKASMVLLLLGILDYAYQKLDFEKNLKMSKQEIKEESKQSEGDPQIKGKIKEKQRQIAMSRMMSDIPKADVIITNPTHFAVAIIYDASKYDAPYVIAKGMDIIAQNIKKIGKECSIPIVENKQLARTLYSSVEIGQTVPEDLFQAVAEVLAYVYSLNE